MEALEKLLCQGDFGQKNQHLLSLLDRFCHRFEINFCLAGTGHAIQQGHGEPARRNRIHQLPCGIGLITGEFGRRIIRIGRRNDGTRRNHDVLEHPLRRKPVNHRCGNPGRVGKASARPGKTIPGKFKHARACTGHPFRLLAGKTQPRHRRLGIEGRRHAQDHPGHHARRRDRIIGGPAHETHHAIIDRRAIEKLRDRPQLFRINRIGRALGYNACNLARTKGNANN